MLLYNSSRFRTGPWPSMANPSSANATAPNAHRAFRRCPRPCQTKYLAPRLEILDCIGRNIDNQPFVGLHPFKDNITVGISNNQWLNPLLAPRRFILDLVIKRFNPRAGPCNRIKTWSHLVAVPLCWPR